MQNDVLDLAIVTDEISRNVEEALEAAAAWGIARFELREGEGARFPFFTSEELQRVEAAVAQGARITAVSPGILKGHVEDERRLQDEIAEVLPRSIDLAQHLGCPAVIVFGFERYAGEPESNRVRVLRAFERVAEAAADAGLIVAAENEPNFWIDQPEASAALLDELGHPAMKLNWDPANLYWGGTLPTYEGFSHVRPHLANLHVKDYDPDDAEAPWKPVGQGGTPWPEIVGWVIHETALPHISLETHCEPLRASSQASVEALRAMIDAEMQSART